MKLSELHDTRVRYPKILIYGPPGCGKTALALTLGAEAQMIDLDDGLMTGMMLKDQHTAARQSVDVIQFLEVEPEKALVYHKVKSYLYDIINRANRGQWPFKYLIIDSLTMLAMASIRSVLYASSILGKKNPEIQHWGMAIGDIQQILVTLRAAPFTVIVLAHDQTKTIKVGEKEENYTELAIFGKNLPSQVGAAFDELWYMIPRPVGQGKNRYLLKTMATDVVTAKSRSSLPDETDTNLGLKPIIDKLGYKLKEAQPLPTPPLTVPPKV